jgi:hypothetical protein
MYEGAIINHSILAGYGDGRKVLSLDINHNHFENDGISLQYFFIECRAAENTLHGKNDGEVDRVSIIAGAARLGWLVVLNLYILLFAII